MFYKCSKTYEKPLSCIILLTLVMHCPFILSRCHSLKTVFKFKSNEAETIKPTHTQAPAAVQLLTPADAGTQAQQPASPVQARL